MPMNSSCFSLWIFSEIIWHSKTDILLNWFGIWNLIIWNWFFISDKAVWNSLMLHFGQFNVTLYWFLTPFQYLVLEFADTWSWMPLNLTLSDMYEWTLYNINTIFSLFLTVVFPPLYVVHFCDLWNPAVLKFASWAYYTQCDQFNRKQSVLT